MLILVVKVRLLLLLLSAKEVPEIFCLENKNTHKLTVKMQLHVALEEKMEIKYLRLVSCRVSSLISNTESLREDKVPGTSSETTLDNFSTETPSFLKACNQKKKKMKLQQDVEFFID